MIVEDADPAMQPTAYPDAIDDLRRTTNRIRTAFLRPLLERGVDLQFGRTLPRTMHELRLRNVDPKGYFPYSNATRAHLEAVT